MSTVYRGGQEFVKKLEYKDGCEIACAPAPDKDTGKAVLEPSRQVDW
jgi:hypothetical protein